MLTAGFWMLGASYRMLGADYFMLGTGFEMLDAKLTVENSVKRFFVTFFNFLLTTALMP
jgi:hypothetical protein